MEGCAVMVELGSWFAALVFCFSGGFVDVELAFTGSGSFSSCIDLNLICFLREFLDVSIARGAGVMEGCAVMVELGSWFAALVFCFSGGFVDDELAVIGSESFLCVWT
jgi:hypothetical protein